MRNLLLIPIFFIFFGCSDTSPIESSQPSTPADLTFHSEEFRKEIIEVTDGVHVAVGFALANAILIEGEGS